MSLFSFQQHILHLSNQNRFDDWGLFVLFIKYSNLCNYGDPGHKEKINLVSEYDVVLVQWELLSAGQP